MDAMDAVIDIRCTDRRTVNPKCPCICHFTTTNGIGSAPVHAGMTCAARFYATLTADLYCAATYARCGPRQVSD
jgi:hypothetical protein